MQIDSCVRTVIEDNTVTCLMDQKNLRSAEVHSHCLGEK